MMNNYSKAKDELIYQGHLWAYNKIKEIGATHALTLSFSAPFTDIARDEKDGKWIWWDENGQKVEEKYYKDNVCISGDC